MAADAAQTVGAAESYSADNRNVEDLDRIATIMSIFNAADTISIVVARSQRTLGSNTKVHFGKLRASTASLLCLV